MRELVCNWQLWARGSIVVTRSDISSIFQEQFGEYHGNDGCYSIYCDSSTIIGSQDYYKSLEYLGLLVYYSAKMCRHRQNGLSYAPTKILTWMLREARGDLKATVGNYLTITLST